MPVRYGSVCSGIEAASVAWEPLGMQPAWFSEIEPFPASVLAHHWPHVPNLGDMTYLPELVRWGQIEAPDILVGGTPCQAFSVAGKQGSLADARGGLTLIYGDLLNAIDEQRPGDECVAVWENVPGVLSTKDNAFGYFLGLLAGEYSLADCLSGAAKPLEAQPGKDRQKWTKSGFIIGPQRTIAWRTLDAQYFGLAQRRKRVFVVASARDGFDPAKVLFELESMRRDTPPTRPKGEVPANALTTGFGNADRDAQTGHLMWWDGGQLCQTLDAVWHKSQTMPEKNRFPAVIAGGRLRTLMPVEGERLQGFPDGHTDVRDVTPDGPRRKAIGNSKAVYAVRWLGRRLLVCLEAR